MGNTICGCLPWNASQPQPHSLQQLSAYSFLGEIGTGTNCTVHRVSRKETGEVLACKSVRIPDGGLSAYQNEVRIMQSLKGHANIVQLKDVRLERPDRQLYIIMELCEGGELLDGVIRIGERYSEKKAAGIFRQIVTIISTCHSAGVIHRDLNPKNLMFSTMEEDSPIKAIGFRLATFFTPGQTFESVAATFPYNAPETLDCEEQEFDDILSAEHGQEVDIWSAGVILFVLLTGFPPFMKDNPHDTDSKKAALEEIKNGYIDYSSAPWSSVSSSAVHLLKRMLKVDPRIRLSAANILEHPWVREGGDASDDPMGIAVIRRMKRFRAICKFGRLPLEVIAETLSEGEIADLKESFKSVDTGNVGTISFEELIDGLNKWGSQLKWKPRFSNSEVSHFVESDGRINYDEFVARMLNEN